MRSFFFFVSLCFFFPPSIQAFSHAKLPPYAFQTLIRAGKWVEYDVGDRLVVEGEKSPRVILIYEGT
jgi:hypothetical protein